MKPRASCIGASLVSGVVESGGSNVWPTLLTLPSGVIKHGFPLSPIET